MATMVKLSEKVDEIVQKSYDLKRAAEEDRKKEYKSAVQVQSWFRACKSRSYLKHLNISATVIQRIWRGFLGRSFFRIMLRNSVYIMKLNYYNKQATVIQKVWRGFYTRKYLFNYYSRKRYLEGLQVKNEIIRAELQEYAEIKSLESAKKKLQSERELRELWARKNHHLVSTEVQPGIYNSPFLFYPSELEFRLRHAKPLDHYQEQTKSEIFDPGYKSYTLPKPHILPPLQNKQQGPFRDPKKVQDQRYKPFQPSLRVATDFFSVDEARTGLKQKEWVERINDNLTTGLVDKEEEFQFLPFTKKKVSYEPMLHTSSKYGHLHYGSKYFREEIDPIVFSKPFRTLVPPIPIFEKLNDTYSQGQV